MSVVAAWTPAGSIELDAVGTPSVADAGCLSELAEVERAATTPTWARGAPASGDPTEIALLELAHEVGPGSTRSSVSVNAGRISGSIPA